MRKGLLFSVGLAALEVAVVLQGAVAAPFAVVEGPMILSTNSRSLEEIYYYHGRYYPYRYNSRYYAHRAY
jgi:hypothetical protein